MRKQNSRTEELEGVTPQFLFKVTQFLIFGCKKRVTGVATGLKDVVEY